MNNENNDIYYEDNSFDNQGVEYTPESDVSIPNQNRVSTGNIAKDFATGFKQGLSGNPALGQAGKGQNSMPGKTPGGDIPNKKGNGSDLGNRSNPAMGQQVPGAKDNNSIQMPRANNPDKKNNPANNNKGPQNNKSNDKKDGLANKLGNKNGKSGLMSRFGPAAKAATGGKGAASKGGASKAGQVAGEGLKKIFMALPPQGKVIMIAVIAVLPIILVFGFFLISILTGTTAVVAAATSCDAPSYNASSTDGTEFLCSMSSPYGDGSYDVTSLFGWRHHPIDYVARFHTGIDLVGAKKTLYAVQDGVVEIASYCGGYGNCVLVKHGENFYTRYAHLSSFASGLSVGDEVKAGDKIGVEGSTGNSTGSHLHFELLDKDMKHLSTNPFFGYSDQGYEQCLDSADSPADYKKCMLGSSGTARYIGQEGFNQICGRSSSYTNGGNNSRCCGTANDSNSDLIDFIGAFEGHGDYCDSAKTKYKAYQNSGDRVTIGYGVTSDYLPDLTHAGQCMDVEKVDAAKLKAMESKRNVIKEKFEGVELTQYEEDAMTSMAYNGCGDYFDDIAKAAKNDNYEEIWNAMKGCRNKGTQFQKGLERRRKAEFALYVTGDYSIAPSYKAKSWSESEYNDYDSDNIMAKKASGSSSSCVSSGDKAAVLEIAARELEANSGASQSTKCSNIKKYMQACGYNSVVHHYCAGFVSYVLKEAGLFDSVGLPDYTCTVTSFGKPTIGEFHKGRGSYIPQPGDLAITSNSRKEWGHIQFVEKVEGETLHIIGGNQSPFNNSCPNNGAGTSLGNVTRYTTSLNSSKIVGYISY